MTISSTLDGTQYPGGGEKNDASKRTRKPSGSEKHAPEIKLLERFVFFLASKPNCISHTIPDSPEPSSWGCGTSSKKPSPGRRKPPMRVRRSSIRPWWRSWRGSSLTQRDCLQRAARWLAGNRTPAETGAQGHRGIYAGFPNVRPRIFASIDDLWICWTAIHLENPNVV